jgi:hypothetical protein
MSRKLMGALAAAATVGVFVAGLSVLWPETASSTVSQLFARANVDHAVSGTPERAYVPAFLLMIDFERHFAGENALPPREYVPVPLTAIEFGPIFRSVNAAASSTNTPPNREKLRNAGWKRLLASG